MGPFSHIVHLEEKKPSEKIGQSIKENIFEKYQKSSDVMDTLSLLQTTIVLRQLEKKFGVKMRFIAGEAKRQVSRCEIQFFPLSSFLTTCACVYAKNVC